MCGCSVSIVWEFNLLNTMFDSSSRSWADTWEQWPVIRARDSGESEEQTEQILWSLRAYLLIHVILGGVLTEQQTKSRDYYLTWHSVARARAAEQICSDFSLFLSVFPRVAAAAAAVVSEHCRSRNDNLIFCLFPNLWWDCSDDQCSSVRCPGVSRCEGIARLNISDTQCQ